MYKKLFFTFRVGLIFFLFSCKSIKPVVPASTSGNITQDYLNSYKDIAVIEMKRSGVPASITLAQGMIESDYGRSRLAREANNHFGIKCHNGWTGPTVRHHDDNRNECFRKYRKPEESFSDHSDFLRTGSRYKFLFEIEITDYKAWARGLKKAGYATNPDYANMLIRKIEENNLMYFDQNYKADTPAKKTSATENKNVITREPVESYEPRTISNENLVVLARVPRVMENNGLKFIIVKDGDTREKLENEFQLLRWELPRYNELATDFQLIPGQTLYLQPKKEKAEAGKDFHTVISGETMYIISQFYGVKLKSMYEMNRMKEGTEPKTGQKIWLRGIKPVN
jgi:LysM repeat protein